MTTYHTLGQTADNAESKPNNSDRMKQQKSAPEVI